MGAIEDKLLSLEEKSERVQSYFQGGDDISEEQVRSLATGEWLLSVLRNPNAEDIFESFRDTVGEQIEGISGEIDEVITRVADEEPRKPERSPLTKHLCSIQL